MAKGDYIVHIPARFLKDSSISADARFLRTVIAAYADGKTGRSFVTPKTLQKTLHWGRRRREKAQAELCRIGWLELKWKRGDHGKFARRVYIACDPRRSVAQFERSGQTAQLISNHSQVKSSIPTGLTESKAKSEEFLEG